VVSVAVKFSRSFPHFHGWITLFRIRFSFISVIINGRFPKDVDFQRVPRRQVTTTVTNYFPCNFFGLEKTKLILRQFKSAENYTMLCVSSSFRRRVAQVAVVCD
jgi:hypothetical protein